MPKRRRPDTPPPPAPSDLSLLGSDRSRNFLPSTYISSSSSSSSSFSPPPRPPNAPSLLSICVKSIALNIERYPVECFITLDGPTYDAILQQRISDRAKSSNSKKIPAISAASLAEIEDSNPHLKTDFSDTIWQQLTNYKLSHRPSHLQVPFPLAVASITSNPASLASPASLSQTLPQLRSLPISGLFLKQTQIGKKLALHVKSKFKLIDADNENNEYSVLLASWKETVASQTQPTPTTELEDPALILTRCPTWRSIYSESNAYLSLKKDLTVSKLKSARSNLSLSRPSSTTLSPQASAKFSKARARQEIILAGNSNVKFQMKLKRKFILDDKSVKASKKLGGLRKMAAMDHKRRTNVDPNLERERNPPPKPQPKGSLSSFIKNKKKKPPPNNSTNTNTNGEGGFSGIKITGNSLQSVAGVTTSYKNKGRMVIPNTQGVFHAQKFNRKAYNNPRGNIP
ncbi:hypothetical protein ScalyP_jg6406 [Parmales sp. scaly parma]|nr:hypothetical protein ScalyP_jg6406 [Parmales sp. scaly parma]